ncbi:hypothetical protein THRCLA_04202 [Thraustotheca clavata]|uniref:Uncharacterized protein n=1 Tax=Thraustotheca clavata TaxID=74557 RepID=A0A1V9ZZQ4_9STRA|nr:hypothetical protein THRCLA_04202 [Thraustotheca clavata]
MTLPAQWKDLVIILQYSKNNNTNVLLQIDLVTQLTDSFGLFSWLYLIEWIQGVREVVNFQDEHNDIATISGRTALLTQTVNSLEVPLNVAYYARCILLYITGVMFLVGALVISHIISSKGKMGGANMFVINRVVGLVWIGRPLPLLRSITALCLLSTASMNLAQINGIFYFVIMDDSWYVAGEITWLVFILSDGFSLITKNHTGLYATKRCVLVWAAAALWCFIHPVQPTTTLHRNCIPIIVDFHIFCFSGTVAIGDYNRFINLIVLAVAIVLVLYVTQRMRFPTAHVHLHNSFWLYGIAQYLFEAKDWIENNVYYIDKASALITGLISLQIGYTIYMLDIKTWRLFSIETSDESVQIVQCNST